MRLSTYLPTSAPRFARSAIDQRAARAITRRPLNSCQSAAGTDERGREEVVEEEGEEEKKEFTPGR